MAASTAMRRVAPGEAKPFRRSTDTLLDLEKKHEVSGSVLLLFLPPILLLVLVRRRLNCSKGNERGDDKGNDALEAPLRARGRVGTLPHQV